MEVKKYAMKRLLPDLCSYFLIKCFVEKYEFDSLGPVIIGASVSEPPLVDSTDALSRYIYRYNYRYNYRYIDI